VVAIGPGGVEYVAGDVELALAGGGVADPDRAAAAVAGEVGEHDLGHVLPAVGPVQHLEGVDAALAGGAGHPVDVPAGLVRAGPDPQGTQDDGGVAQPGIAVVPVGVAPDHLRQRRGGGGHDRPVRLRRQSLEDEPGAADLVGVGPVVPVVRLRPVLPHRHRVVDHRRRGAPPVVGARDRGVVGPEDVAGLVSGAQPQRAPGAAGGGLGGRRTVEVEPEAVVGTVEAEAPARRRAGGGRVPPVVEQGHELDRQLHLAVHRPHVAGQCMRDLAPHPVGVGPGKHEGVGQLDHPAGGAELVDQHQRAGEVPARGGEPAGGPDRPVPGLGVEQPGEHARGVEPG
jgi:hypothetical protein